MLMETGVAAGERDYRMEGHLKAIARWYLWGGSLLVIPALIALVAMLFGGTDREPDSVIFRIIGVGVLVILSGLLLTSSHLLSRFSDTTRIVLLVLNAIACALGVFQVAALLWAPIGAGEDPKKVHHTVAVAVMSLIWYGTVCWALGSKRSAEVCTPRYRSSALTDPGPSGWSSPFFWLPIALGFSAVFLRLA